MKWFLMIFLMIFLISCTKNFNQIQIDNGQRLIKIKVEIADENDERLKGLMFRQKLDENAGMFFIYDKEGYQSFWMKNTLIPLDIIFINENLEIVDIENAVPCQDDPCISYPSSKPARYVLEVNGGFAAKNDVKIGDKIVLG